MKAFKFLIIVLVLCSGGWYAWTKFHTPAEAATPAAGGPGGAAQAPMPVSVATIKAAPVQQWLQFSGRLVAVDTVDVRPRVGGAIQTIYFKPGEIVEKNAPLFLIDPRPYQAELSRAKAAVAVSNAQLTLAQTDLQRAQRLIGENAISRRDVDERQNAVRVAEASQKGALATVEQAELNLNYATITAPVRGRISRAEITQGNLVNPANATVLATIVSVDSIYADFEVDEQTYISMIRKQNESTTALPVELILNSDDKGGTTPNMSYPGKIASFDNQLDAASGTIRARAIFENKDKALVPGMFANIRLGQAEAESAILVPERLINTDQDKKFVYLVDAANKVTYRQVTLGNTVQGMRIVTAGVQEGDRIVADGLQKVRPDMVIAPQDVPLTDTAKVDAAPATPKVEPAAGNTEQNDDAAAMPEPIEPVPVKEAVDNVEPSDDNKDSTH